MREWWCGLWSGTRWLVSTTTRGECGRPGRRQQLPPSGLSTRLILIYIKHIHHITWLAPPRHRGRYSWSVTTVYKYSLPPGGRSVRRRLSWVWLLEAQTTLAMTTLTSEVLGEIMQPRGFGYIVLCYTLTLNKWMALHELRYDGTINEIGNTSLLITNTVNEVLYKKFPRSWPGTLAPRTSSACPWTVGL